MTQAQSFRNRIFAAVMPVLEKDPTVRGAWESGSVATGRADAFSDIDLCVVADTSRHDVVLDSIETQSPAPPRLPTPGASIRSRSPA